MTLVASDHLPQDVADTLTAETRAAQKMLLNASLSRNCGFYHTSQRGYSFGPNSTGPRPC